MLLRVEDTDRARSTEEAVEAIYDGLRWLGLDWDDDAVSQASRVARHQEVANQLLADGRAYRCYATPEELAKMRETARAEGRSILYDGRWRDRDPAEAPAGVDPVIRLKAPRDGETVVDDLVQGRVVVGNGELDDLVLLRSDGTPTYMLAVVVDDHDMAVTHVIRGDDHFTNTFRQRQIYDLLDWTAPAFAHIPLIHGPDGAKLSKRHGALAVQAYRDMGYLPEAVCNYLLRLGWSHGDDEIISSAQAIDWFGLESVGKSPARFDFEKLASLNGHYIRDSDPEHMFGRMLPFLEARLSRSISDIERARILILINELKERSKTLVELADSALFCAAGRPLPLDENASKLLTEDARALLSRLASALTDVHDWSTDGIENAIRAFADREALKFGKVAQPLRAALTGTNKSPGIFQVLFALGRDESIGRIQDVCI